MVYILLASGFEEAEALVPADLLRRAGVPVSLTSVEGAPAVTGAHGITVQTDGTVDAVNADDVELLMLPGGMGGVNGIAESEAAVSLIRAVQKRGAWLAAICAAPTLLGALGLLEGKQAVCYPGMEARLTGAVVRAGQSVVWDDSLITGEGPGSAFPFGLALVEALKGRAAMEQVRHDVHYHG